MRKNQKPVSYEMHLKYICPGKHCDFIHWISINQAKTKNYKIVCDCGNVFKPKRIRSIKIKYAIEEIKNIKTNPSISADKEESINTDMLNKCIKILINYGFTDIEARDYIISAYSINPTNNIIQLIKFTLEQIGENNGKWNSTN